MKNMTLSDNTNIGWCCVAIALSFLTFGFFNIFYGILYILCFFGGLVAVLYDYSKKEVKQQNKYFTILLSPETSYVCSGIKTILDVDYSTHKLKEEKLTGSPGIDDGIHMCLDYLMRDYVKYWYNSLSDDNEFLHYFKSSIQDCIRDISLRCKAIDWQPYLSTILVDEFAKHVRLFRKAKQKLASGEAASEHQESRSASGSPMHHANQTLTSENGDEKSCILDFYFDHEIISDNICRDLVACDPKSQLAFFQDVSEVLLFVLLPENDFHCRPLKSLLRETVVHGILFPMFKLYTNSDYLNQYVNWMISDNCVVNEWFLSVLRHSRVMGELRAVREKAEEEIDKLRSKDGVGDDPVVKQQLSSMRYVMNVCERQIHKQHEGNVEIVELESSEAARGKLYNLPLSVVLRNNVALQIFIEFMQSVNGQPYLFFWLTVDGYRASAEQQLSEAKIQQMKSTINGMPDMEMLRTIGHNIYEQYLSKHAEPRVPLDPIVDKQLKRKLDSGEPSPYVFDDIQQKVFNMMQKNEQFFPAFKASVFYVKLLAELDLLREPSLTSGDTNGSTASGSSPEESLTTENEDVSKLNALITQTGICTEHGKTYALYAITISRQWGSGKEESWSTFRRYREFYDLHSSLKENGSNLGNLRLPGRTFFKDLKEEFLEKRRTELNHYLSTVLSMEHPVKAMECIHTFLDAKAYQRNSKSFARKVDTMMRTSVRNVTNFVAQAPDNLIDGIQKASDKVSDGIQKFSVIFPNSSEQKDDDEKLFEQSEFNIDNNIPLGILLLLMDEVFDLKQKNQWFRRQMVGAVQQVMRTLFGDRMNRKIIDYVENALSADQVAVYIDKFKENFWPGGILAEETSARDEATIMRTRVLTKSKMHGAIPDELRPIVGSETCRRGVQLLFELIQYRELNQRFCCVLLESILTKLFPSNKFSELFNEFHSASPKLRAHKRELMSRGLERGKPGSNRSSLKRNASLFSKSS